ncbi:hypothetical protein WJX73_001907 [Symbiochloris irregularis]|uniref:CCR4-NOT transcription complex subunit 1 n=1 Tax=Symbiochloris irregularis TaxID=706552 RepID=A0AAW1P5X5_9CHLO
MMARTHKDLKADPHGLHAKLLAALGSHNAEDAQPTGWKPDVMVDVLKEAYPHLRWEEVAACLDYEGFIVPDDSANMLLLSTWQRAAGTSFPLEVLCQRQWSNSLGQLSFLKYAVGVPPHLVRWDQAPRKLAPVEGLAGGKAATGTSNRAWLCLDLLDTLARLAELGHHAAVQGILEAPLKQCPEVLLLGMGTAREDWSHLHLEALSQLVLSYVADHPNSGVVLPRLWHTSHPVVLDVMVTLHSNDNTTAIRSLQTLQELNGLPVALESTPAPFALELAMLVARGGDMGALQAWLQDMLSRRGQAFYETCLEFLDLRMAGVGQPDSAPAAGLPGRVNLSMEALAVALRVLNLQVADGSLPSELASKASRIQQQAVQAHPDLASGSALSGTISETQFSDVIEREANSYYQQVYAKEGPALQPQELLNTLKRLQSSSSDKDQTVAKCMIFNLLDEYRFFMKYPDRELAITATLFGGLVQLRLVKDKQLGTVLTHIHEALLSPPGSKLFNFARQCLRQSQEELLAWPQYCSLLLQVPHFREAEPQLAGRLEQAMREFSEGRAGALPDEPSFGPGPEGPSLLGSTPSAAAPATSAPAAPAAPQQPADTVQGPAAQDGIAAPAEAASGAQENQPTASSAPAEPAAEAPAAPEPPIPAIQPPPPPMDPNRAFQAHNLETLEAALLAANIPYPAQLLQDQVAFLMNNLSPDNLSTKSDELKGALTSDHWNWFVNYMVVRRAAQEVNHHKLYINLIDSLSERELFKQLLATSYKYIRILLASEHIKTKSGERSLLRNLGSWLGCLTLARRQPVRQKDLDLKKIVYEAYEQGKMIAVLPFVVKTLESCSTEDNTVFTKSNPWIAAILALAAEIYQLDKLKLNIKFEIEKLFRLFALNASVYKPSDTLSCHVRDPTDNPDFYGSAAARAPSSGMVPSPIIDRVQQQQPAATPAAAGQEQAALPAAPSPQRPSTDSGGSPPAAGPTLAGPPSLRPAPQQQPAEASATPQPPAGAPRLPEAPQTAPVSAAPPAATEQQTVAPGVPNFAALHQSVVISPTLASLSERLQLPKIVPMAVDHAIAEIIFPTVERSVTIGRMTTIELVNKDFALEADEGRMRNGAHLMAGSLSGSLALVTGREPLRHSLTSQLRGLLTPSLEAHALESTITTIVNDNLDLGCALIEKAATDKAIAEIDDHLMTGYQMRQRARAAGQNFVDASMAQRFPAGLPQQLRPKAGHLTPAQMRVYEDFARVPHPAGPGPAGALGRPGDGQAGDSGAMDDAQARQSQLNIRFSAWLARTEALINKENQAPSPAGRQESSDLAQSVNELATIAETEEGTAVLARKVFARMFEISGFRLHTTAMAAALQALAVRVSDGRLAREVVGLWTALSRAPAPGNERKWRFDAIEALLRHRLLPLSDLDTQTAEALGSPQRSQLVVDFAVKIMRTAVVADQMLGPNDLPAIIEALYKLSSASNTGTLAHLLSLASAKRTPKAAPPDYRYPGIRDRVTEMLSEWVNLQEDHPAEKVQASFVAKLDKEGFLKGGELTDQFLHVLMDVSINYHSTHEAAGRSSAPSSYLVADSFTRLMCILISAHRGGAALLAKVLSVWSTHLQKDAEASGTDFNGRPYFRICVGAIQELSPSSRSDNEGITYLATIANALLDVQPLRVPGFTFPWLELVSHRNLMPKLLLAEGVRAWQPFYRLMMALLRFLEPYLRNAHLTDAVRLLYKGTLRVLLVLLHDLPEFLCEYHFELVSVVPTSCIQMRNLILSAFPRTMRLPDPFTPNLKVDLLPEITMTPLYRPPSDSLLPASLRAEVQSYISTRQPPTFPSTLAARMALSPTDALLCEAKYNVPMLNAFVFYVGLTAIPRTKGAFTPKMSSPQMDIFSAMAIDMDPKGRHLFINAIANQLRYPNVHTHFFSCVLLYLFLDAPKEVVQEQITRVLLERLIVNRPHPWGLLVTFIELIKNPRYQFWSRKFTHCAAEIERLFDSVAHSCMSAGRPADDAVAASSPTSSAGRGRTLEAGRA